MNTYLSLWENPGVDSVVKNICIYTHRLSLLQGYPQEKGRFQVLCLTLKKEKQVREAGEKTEGRKLEVNISEGGIWHRGTFEEVVLSFSVLVPGIWGTWNETLEADTGERLKDSWGG